MFSKTYNEGCDTLCTDPLIHLSTSRYTIITKKRFDSQPNTQVDDDWKIQRTRKLLKTSLVPLFTLMVR